MARAQRMSKNSVEATALTFQSANELPEPTEPLNERELSYFHRVIRSRELATWSDHDISLATDLAMTQVQYLEAMAAVKAQGRTTLSERGTPVANPETAALSQLASSLRAFTAQLGLSASQRGVGAGAKQDVRNQAERDARKVIAKVAEDDLLA